MVRTPTCKKPKRRRKKCQWKFTENVEFAAPKESAISALPRRALAARLPSGGSWRLTPKPPNTADDKETGRDGAGRLLVKRQTPKWRHGQGILPQYMPLITQLRYLVSALVTAWSLPKSAIAPKRRLWRRGWDSNPRRILTLAGFQDRCDRPLCHLSGARGGSRTQAGRILALQGAFYKGIGYNLTIKRERP